MKRLVIIFQVVFATTAYTQSLVEDGKEWNIEKGCWWDWHTWNYNMQGDTTINNTQYKIVWKSDTFNTNGVPNYYVREDTNERVYIYIENQEHLLYDFSIGPGDLVTVYSIDPMICPIDLWVDTVIVENVMGIPRKKWTFLNAYEVWYEGIGSLMGLFSVQMESCMTDCYHQLLCYHENDTLRYIWPSNSCYESTIGINEHNKKFRFSIHPNPTTGKFEVSGLELGVTVQVFDLVGRRVYPEVPEGSSGNDAVVIDLSPYPAGIYYVKIGERTAKLVLSK